MITCGGVYVERSAYQGNIISGTLTKTGETIYGYSESDTVNGNVVKDSSGNIVNNCGHAVYAGSSTPVKRKETTAGPDVNLFYNSDGTYSGDWDY